MNAIVYVAHGAEWFRQEAVYSILSALRLDQGATDFEVLVVTDEPASFRRYLGDLPRVRYFPVDRAQLDAWRGGADGYVHRIKPHAILHAVRGAALQPEDAVLFMDSDTAFEVDPALLFGRIAAGDVLLNELEGRVADLRHNTRSHGRLHAALQRQPFTVDGKRRLLPMELPLWNSGVIGLRRSQIGVFDETIALIDQMWPALQIAATEQVALSAVLNARRIRPRETLVEVLHYHVFKEFRNDLARFFAQHAGATPRQWVTLSAEIDPFIRIQPKLEFNRLPKWWRQVRKAVGRPWRPVPYPWARSTAGKPGTTQ